MSLTLTCSSGFLISEMVLSSCAMAFFASSISLTFEDELSGGPGSKDGWNCRRTGLLTEGALTMLQEEAEEMRLAMSARGRLLSGELRSGK